jgi:hypothetical protein
LKCPDYQDRELFGFFVTGLSAIESTCYGLFAIGSILDRNNFSFETEKHRRNANTASTVKQFAETFCNYSVTIALQAITRQQEYKDWKKVRNNLAHRINPGRKVYVVVGGTQTAEWVLQGIPMDNTAAASRREWLANSLHDLLTAADTFTANCA